MNDQPIRVFVVEAEELMRAGLRLAIDGAPELQLVGEATTVAEATARLPLAAPTSSSSISICRTGAGPVSSASSTPREPGPG